MRSLIAGVAALALVPALALADPGGGKGGGGGGQGKGGGNQGQAAHADHGAKAGPANDANRGQGQARGPERRDMRPEMSRPGPATVRLGNEGRGNSDKARPERQTPQRAERANDNADKGRDARRDDVVRVTETRLDDRADGGLRWSRGTGLVNGCPPGLAKKNNGCQPPGLARQNAAWYQPDWYRWRGLESGDYRYYDGYLLRMGGNNVLGYVPLLGGALSLGNPWPTYLEPVALPDYYRDYYGLGDPGGYGYYGDTIYRLDPRDSEISSIAALLTGDQFAVGRPLPYGYDVYNVPYDYRDRYADGPDSLYRYSDGYVYQVDPTTRLIEAIIQLLV